jgi:hypothetical protein
MKILDILAAVAPYLNTAALNACILWLFISIYPPRFNHKSYFVICWAAITLLNVGVNAMHNPTFNLITLFVIINGVSFTLFRAKLSNALVYNQLYVIIVMLCDALTAFIASARHGVSLQSFLDDEQKMVIPQLTLIVVVFTATRIFALMLVKRAKWKIRATEIVILLVLILFEGYTINYLMNAITDTDSVYRTIIITVGFGIVNGVIAYEIHKISTLYREKYEADIGIQQNRLETTHYNEIIANYERYRRVIHDIRKHLSTLTSMYTGQTEDFYAYARSISEKMERMFDEFRCKSRILSIIMTQKIRVAESAHIQLLISMEDADISFLHDSDITAIFANLWDNAIEAVMKLPEAERMIKITMVKKNSMLMVQFENNFTGKLLKFGNTFLTTKGGDHTGSGFGIIRTAAESYGGRVVLNSRAQVFSAMVLFPVGEDAPKAAVS